jgi:hypothetical protein
MAKYSEAMGEHMMPDGSMMKNSSMKKGKRSAKMMMLKNMISKRKNKGKKASKYATALA